MSARPQERPLGDAVPARELAGKTAVVTGAAAGIGRAVAIALARAGARRLILVDRDVDRLAETAKELSCADDPHIDSRTVDVADPAAMAELARSLAEGLDDGLDIVVTCAGILGPVGPIAECCVDDWDEVFAVNVRGTFLCIRHLLPRMRNKGGAVVTIASAAGLTGSVELGAYGASKAAVIMMTRSLALQHAADGIRVNCVCPGSIDTEMLDRTLHAAPSEAAREERRSTFLHRHPIGRFGRPEEVAEAVVYLAGPRSSFLTGIALPVDGGRLA